MCFARALKLFIGACACAAWGGASPFDIPYRKTVLDNGLTVIVHEDAKAPIVAVNVWYKVGSRDERPGRTGFAHLFEHLMFNGSEHFNDDWFKAMERVGATGMNGTTSRDRTNYFQEVPRDALDFALWMESDRMGHLLGAVDQARLEEQRGVVLNEKRQGDNRPYAVAWRLITQSTWPAGHPYSWQVIGSEEDIRAATLEDVREWFAAYYGAANAVVVIAGDVKADEAFEKVRRAFGEIPPGPPVVRETAHVAKRAGTRRMTAQDRVPQARLYKVWNIPPYGTMDGNLLELAAGVLSRGKASRLYRRLVHEGQLATDVSAWADLGGIAGQFAVVATARPGVSLAEVERAVDEELAAFLSKGPEEAELRRVKAASEADFIRGCERVGGFGGKSDVLAHNFVFTGDAEYYKTVLRETREATRRQVRDAARQWLSDGAFVLGVEPFPEWRASAEGLDRSRLPQPELKPEAVLPEVREAVLANGLRVVLAERHDVPVVQLRLLVRSGYAADAAGASGTASLCADMLGEGTRRRTGPELSAAFDGIGAGLDTWCGADTAGVGLNTLTRHFREALELYAEVVLEPAFREEDFERLKRRRLAAIEREKSDPQGVAMRVLPGLVYGKGHVYGVPFSGNGRAAEVERLTREDVRRFYATWFRPGNATLVAVGDTTLEALVPELERRFGRWQAAEVPALAAAGAKGSRGVYLIDRPGAAQSVVVAGFAAPPRDAAGEHAVEVMNALLGGAFTSRINLNLREEKHWSYGARTTLRDMAGPRALVCVAPVQGDKTAETLAELAREFREVVGGRPPTAEEVEKTVTDRTLRLAGQWETMGAVAGVLEQMVRHGVPEAYYRGYAAALRALTAGDVARAAARVVRPEEVVWLVVGDRAKVEGPIRALGWGEVTVLDAEGEPVVE